MDSNLASPIVFYGLLGFVVAWALVPLILKLVRRRVTEARSTLELSPAPISRYGGVALAAAFLAITFTAGAFLGRGAIQRHEWVIICGALAMFGVGLLDDLRPLGARIKFVAQILIASGVYCGGVEIQNFTNPITHASLPFGAWGYFATVFWLVAMTNLINLVDGIDGLAGGIAFMLMCLLVYTGLGNLNFDFLLAVGVAGSLLAFIYYNFPPAKIYLGDGGAYFLGFLIGLLTVESSQKGTVAAALIAPIFALALPIMDVFLAILRRGVKGLPIFRPDRHHIHHRLLASGLSRQRTLLMLYAVSLVFLVMAFVVFWSQGRLAPILCGLMFLLLALLARSLGLVRDWFAADGILSNVFRLRKEIRYALCLSRWLELEAERCATLPDLWCGFVFVVAKLGLVRVKLLLENGDVVWSRPGAFEAVDLQSHLYKIGLGNIQAIEIAAGKADLSPRLFQHLSELAAEAWVKAALRWERVQGQPIRVDSTMTAPDLEFWRHGKHFPVSL